MLSFFFVMAQLWLALRVALRDPEFRSLGLFIGILLATGTIFYHNIEGWGWLDSLYFCVITLATIGYGDFSPQTALGKLFTMGYALLGIGLLVALFTQLAGAFRIARQETQTHREQRHHYTSL